MAIHIKNFVILACCGIVSGFATQNPGKIDFVRSHGQICSRNVPSPVSFPKYLKKSLALRMADEDEDAEVEDDIPLEIRMDALRRMRKFKEIKSGQTMLQSGNYRETETPIEMDARKVKEILDDADDEDPPMLLDVREVSEHQFCRIDGSVLIPMSEMRERCVEIPKDRLILVYCHHGMRSMQVVRYLRTRGWNMVSNVRGGIDEWSNSIDPAIPRY